MLASMCLVYAHLNDKEWANDWKNEFLSYRPDLLAIERTHPAFRPVFMYSASAARLIETPMRCSIPPALTQSCTYKKKRVLPSLVDALWLV